MKLLILVILAIFIFSCKISAPDKPKCKPNPAHITQKVKCETKGSDPLKVHDFMFDWGDGSEMKWKSDKEQCHKWTSLGTFKVKVKEQCPWYVFYTDWSKESEINIVP